jgi:hypothetical protein
MWRRTLAILVMMVAALASGISAASAQSKPAVGEGAAVAPQGCTYQYVFIGNDGTIRDTPGGAVVGFIYYGYKVNSPFPPDSTWDGWISGNVYTPDNQYVGTGWVLRQYLSYVRYWC